MFLVWPKGSVTKVPDYHNRMFRINTLAGGVCPKVEGRIGKSPWSMLIDTGAAISVVSARLVSPEQYLRKKITLTLSDGSWIQAQVAKIWINGGEFRISWDGPWRYRIPFGFTKVAGS